MRVVFFGTPELAVPSITALHKAYGVQALVCQPDRPKGRGRKVEPPPAKVCADQLGIPVYQPEKLNDGVFEAWLREMQPDLCAVAAYGRMLQQPLLEVPPLGFLNLHPSLLPKYRGASPIQTALLNGDTVTGITIMRIVLEMDAGDILMQEEAPVLPEDTSATLSDRLAARGAELFVEAVASIASGNAVFTPQNPAQVVACRKLEKEDGLLRWDRSAAELHNLVRAAIPWPVAYTSLRGIQIRIHRTSVIPRQHDALPGTIVSTGTEGILVATGNGTLSILALQAPGKRVVSSDEYLRGNPVQPGERMGEP